VSESTAPIFRAFVDQGELARGIVAMSIEKILAGLDEKSVFHLSLTGGNTGNLVSQYLAGEFNQDPERFNGLHLWWGDERFVPLNSTDRNDLSLRLHLNERSPIHLHSVLPPEAVLDVETAAKRYNADLHGIDMDLAIFGVGPDGHLASLFPNRWDTDADRDVIAVRDSPKPPPDRVSFSMKKINRSDILWLIAAGESKKLMVARIVTRDPTLPVNHAHGIRETIIFVDFASAPNQ
jgi:6-phosphogluconolactonase